jgi:hypothetical protein
MSDVFTVTKKSEISKGAILSLKEQKADIWGVRIRNQISLRKNEVLEEIKKCLRW